MREIKFAVVTTVEYFNGRITTLRHEDTPLENAQLFGMTLDSSVARELELHVGSVLTLRVEEA